MSALKSAFPIALNQSSKVQIWTYLLLAIFILVTYLPLILQGGIIVDDWGDIYPTLSCQTFFECYRTWFPLFSNRPLAPLSITGFTMLFGTQFQYYLIFNSFIYLLALLITARVIRSIIGEYPTLIFLFLSCIPIISIPIIASPINQSTATFAFLYWALSLACLEKFCTTSSKPSYFLSYALLLCGFLTYEVILPLLVLTASLPLIINKTDIKYITKKYFAQFILPIFVILSLVTLWQKGFAPNIFGVDYSRLTLSAHSIYASFYSWGSVFTNQIPNLFIKTKYFLTPAVISGGLFLVLGIGISYYGYKHSQTPANNRSRLFYACFFCFLSSALIFILSGATAESGGYQARGLSSTWISLALLISAIAGMIDIKFFRIGYLILVLMFGFLSSLSFSIQRDGYIQSWQLQNEIISNVVDLAKKSEIPRGAAILGVVPQFIPKNYNDEIVFSQPWDFGSALSIITNNYITNGYPIDPGYSQLKGLYLSQNGVKGTNWGGADWKNLWLYRFDVQRKIGSISRIQSENELKDHLLSIGYLEDFDNHSLVRPGQPILFSQKIVNDAKYIKEGWSGQESWGRWSNGRRSQLILPLPIEPIGTLKISANAFITKAHPNLELQVLVNGLPDKIYSLNKAENNDIAVTIPPSARLLPYLTIDLIFTNPMSPKELGMGTDDRKLGIGIKALSFTR
jgi:hypothetical protein